jgi:hypothetical protein
MEEIWKDIPGYEGCYQVSNLGRVKSLEREVKNKYGFRTIEERILKLSKYNYGKKKERYYFVCNLNKKSKRKTHFVHALVAKVFMNHDAGHYFVVDHIDNNSLNNRLDNLQIVSQKINSTKDRDKDRISIYRNKTNGRIFVYAYIDDILTRIGSSKFEDRIESIINKIKRH